MPLMPTTLTARRRHQRRRRRHRLPRRDQKVGLSSPSAFGSLKPFIRPAPPRHSTSDSDSDYGSRAKKKKRPKVSGDELRVSSRGVKIPNYVDDVQDFGQFDEEEDGGSAYYVDPNVPYKEEDEIEAVLSHGREEGREDDPEDLWFDNVVGHV
jgi:chromodomain-helicase-DNA-binding protein 1